MVTADEIRAHYPNAKAFDLFQIDKGDYDVGGALCYYLGIPPFRSPNGYAFPSQNTLRIALQNVNSNLDNHPAIVYASRIIKHNDQEMFDLAWDLVDEAFNYGGNEK